MKPDPAKPGRKPRRLYVRWVMFPDGDERPASPERAMRTLVSEFDRAGRLVAHGELTAPAGDFLIFRADDRWQAERLLRSDPFREIPGAEYRLFDWKPGTIGSGVNIEPPLARGSGRITLLQRVAVVVSDLPRAKDWYCDALGMMVVQEDPANEYVELGLVRGSTAIALIAPRRAWGEPYFSEAMARMGSVTGIVFQTDSVRALELRLRHAGGTITRPESVEPWGRKVIQFADPDGNEFLAFEVATGKVRLSGRSVTNGRRAAEP
jgi:catechol 2,3-dioxygenase-like lactoylglutathione lyase family enzyme